MKILECWTKYGTMEKLKAHFKCVFDVKGLFLNPDSLWWLVFISSVELLCLVVSVYSNVSFAEVNTFQVNNRSKHSKLTVSNGDSDNTSLHSHEITIGGRDFWEQPVLWSISLMTSTLDNLPVLSLFEVILEISCFYTVPDTLTNNTHTHTPKNHTLRATKIITIHSSYRNDPPNHHKLVNRPAVRAHAAHLVWEIIFFNSV